VQLSLPGHSQAEAELVKLQIVDSATNTSDDAALARDLRDAQGVFLLYDITSIAGWDELQATLTRISKLANREQGSILLVGTKADMFDTRATPVKTVEKFCRKHRLAYCEASPKEGTGVVSAVARLCFDVWTRDDLEHRRANADDRGQDRGGRGAGRGGGRRNRQRRNKTNNNPQDKSNSKCSVM
jgi:GTPase SAR1 family protein